MVAVGNNPKWPKNKFRSHIALTCICADRYILLHTTRTSGEAASPPLDQGLATATVRPR